MKKDRFTLLPTPTFLYRHRLYLRLIGQSQHQEFLDIGTGHGYLPLLLAKKGFKGTALDNSTPALKIARVNLKKYSQIKISQLDFYKLPISNKFDQIFCFEVLVYIKDPQKFINKISRHLRPGGRLLFSVGARKKYWNNLDTKKGCLHRFEKAELLQMFAKAGFKINTFYSYGFPILTLLRDLNKSGKFVTLPHHNSNLSKVSSLIQDYNPKLKFLFHPLLMKPIFFILDRFLQSDKGLGFIIEARKQAN